jgi:hypothetical protein
MRKEERKKTGCRGSFGRKAAVDATVDKPSCQRFEQRTHFRSARNGQNAVSLH